MINMFSLDEKYYLEVLKYPYDEVRHRH